MNSKEEFGQRNEPPTSNRGVTNVVAQTQNGTAIVNSGLDWYTATTISERVGYAWYEVFNKYREKQISGGRGWLEEWKNLGYTGLECEGLSWGYSPRHGYIMIARSVVAENTWRKVLPIARNITRLDLAVTCKLPKPVPDLVDKTFAVTRLIKQRRYDMRQNSRGGSTLYVGSRQTDQFGRLYDKGVESKSYNPGVLWRYEVELKKPRSLVMAKRIYEQFQKGISTELSIIGYVWDWFDGREVRPLFRRSGCNMVVEVEKRITSADKKIAWLRSQVGPTVQKLIALGHHKQIVDALGLDAEQLEELRQKSF